MVFTKISMPERNCSSVMLNAGETRRILSLICFVINPFCFNASDTSLAVRKSTTKKNENYRHHHKL